MIKDKNLYVVKSVHIYNIDILDRLSESQASVFVKEVSFGSIAF